MTKLIVFDYKCIFKHFQWNYPMCHAGKRSTNKRLQKEQFAHVDVFNTDKKGL